MNWKILLTNCLTFWVHSSRRPNRNKTGIYEEELPLKSLLICGKCGYKLTGTFKIKKSGKGYGYYHSERKYCKCKVNISTKKLHGDIESILESLKPNPEVKKLIRQMVAENSKSQSQSKSKEIAKLKKQLGELDVKKSKLMDKFVDDDISKKDYTLFNSKIDEQITKIKYNISTAKANNKNIDKYIEQTVSFFDNLDTLYTSGDSNTNKKIMSSILDKNIEIFENDSRTPKFKEVVHLICSGSNGLQANKNKKGDLSNEKSPRVTLTGFEPVAPSLGNLCSIHLSYRAPTSWVLNLMPTSWVLNLMVEQIPLFGAVFTHIKKYLQRISLTN
jgi:site-specific DNA recombinase